MYIPRHNEEKRVSIMHALMVSHPLATFVTLATTGLFASHIPMVLEDDGSEFGILRGHISRANPQWRDFNPAVEALAIFAGHQHYITPTWYPGTKQHGKEVPTWNYVVVHAYGSLQVTHDHQWLLTNVENLTDIHERRSPVPWRVSDAPEDFIKSQLNGIVGIEVPIKRLEGKWKVSQNRDEHDREGVIEGLARLDTPESRAMKVLVEDARGHQNKL
ncbi:MAG: FMN-binding negative transcriptional regulator [Terriglobales bacterium]|jgi:transcriptional regulator